MHSFSLLFLKKYILGIIINHIVSEAWREEIDKVIKIPSQSIQLYIGSHFLAGLQSNSGLGIDDVCLCVCQHFG